MYLPTYFLFLVINVWTTEQNRRPKSHQGLFSSTEASNNIQENKFGKSQTMGGHAGKYTPSESLPNLAHRLVWA